MANCQSVSKLQTCGKLELRIHVLRTCETELPVRCCGIGISALWADLPSVVGMEKRVLSRSLYCHQRCSGHSDYVSDMPMCNSMGCTVFIFCVTADSFNLRCTSWSQVSISVVSGSTVTLRCKDERLSEEQTNALSRRADCQRS